MNHLVKLLTLAALLVIVTSTAVFAQKRLGDLNPDTPNSAPMRGISNADLEQRFGPGSSAGNNSQGDSVGTPPGDPCVVVNYSSYNETRQRTRPSVTTYSGSTYGSGDYVSGTGVTSGGGTITETLATYVTVAIQNTSQQMKRIDTGSIQVYTIKGNSITAQNGKKEYIEAGKTVTITGLKFNPISEIVGIKVSCY